MDYKIKFNHVTPFSNIREMMDIAVREAGPKTAFMYRIGRGDDNIKSITFSEFNDDVNSLGTALTSRGLIGKHVACISENSYKMVCLFLAGLMGNGVYFPIDRELTVPEVVHLIDHSDSEVLFYAKKYEKVVDAVKESVPAVKHFICFDPDESAEDCKYEASFDQLIAEGSKQLSEGNTAFLDFNNNPDDFKMLIYTSGTTGDPKGVMLSENNLVKLMLNGFKITQHKTKCLSVLPYNHTYEAVAGILASIHQHACICINENTKTVQKNLQFYKPDIIFIVPAYAELFYKKIMSNIKKQGKEKKFNTAVKVSKVLRKFGIDLRKKLFGEVREVFGGNMVKVVCGGAPLRPEIGQFFDDIGIYLCNGYGITECSPLISVNSEQLDDYRTVGLPIPGLDVKIDSPNEDGEGEICAKGPTVMLGYYKNPEATAEAMAGGWFHTGDLGKFTDKGQIVITGRKKNMIVLRNGKNVYPEELENTIMDIPFVAEVIVSAIPGTDNEEVGLKAEVFLNEEELKEMGIAAEDRYKVLKAKITEKFADYPRYKQISQVEIRDTEFPKTTTRKIKRRKVTN